jgi:subtilisin family serine protease
MPGVVAAQLDHRVAAQEQPDDPRYAEQWHLPRIGMPLVWPSITDASASPIAILDTGVKQNHPDLAGQLWTNTGEIPNNGADDDGNGFADDMHGWHFYHVFDGQLSLPRQDAAIDDPNGHGTHVAGIIGAAGNNGVGVSGVAWHARVMVVRVLDQDTFGWESDIIQGLSYAVANGARVVNMSLGLSKPSPLLADAIAQAQARGVLIVAAAGNNGGAMLYPAAYPGVISVGASDQTNARASFSSIGERLDLLAPGVGILSTWNGLPYFTRSGTSMATPQVTGVAALLVARNPAASPAELRSCLLRTALDLGAPGHDNATGWGLLNAAAALGCSSHLYLPLMNR